MILANDFLEYLLNTERDLAARVRDRYDMYLKSLPVPQLADGKIVIDGRYMIDSHQGNYRLYRVEGGNPYVIGIYQRLSSVIADVIADSVRITHRHANTEDTVLEIQRLAAVCHDTLNGMRSKSACRQSTSGTGNNRATQWGVKERGSPHLNPRFPPGWMPTKQRTSADRKWLMRRSLPRHWAT
ncbi:putative phage DNA replication domain protein [Escherichia coli DEC10E]|nr:putative phage DNA replication domain protein [Escherichia coli DEC10E]